MKNPITKTWEKVKSFRHKSSSTFTKSKSYNGSPRQGFFTVYVGPTKQRVVVKTKLVNHPLFKNLLEDAETEYGYRNDGPIVLPCEVDVFLKVLADIKKSNGGHDDDYDDDDDGLINPPICGICSPYRSYTDSMAMRRNGSYKLLRNRF